MRKRRTFNKEFKTEIVSKVLNGKIGKDIISKQYEISIPLLDRWINDYLATRQSKSTSMPLTERRKNHQSEQELKAKIAELYMKLEKAGYYHKDGPSLFS